MLAVLACIAVLTPALLTADVATGTTTTTADTMVAETRHKLSASDPCPLVAPRGGEPVGTTPCPGVRPGALVYLNKGLCTLNFLFEGSDGHRYIGTAGHCALDSDAEIVYDERRAPPAHDSEDKRIGRVVYALLDDRHDFALIRLDRGIRAKAKMCHFGGPTGINSELTDEPVTLHHYGNGIGIGHAQIVDQPVLPARSAIAYGMPDRDRVSAAGVAAFGDSGSGTVDDDGDAVGVLVAVGPTGIHITRIAPQVIRAERALGVTLELETAAFSG